MGLRTPSALLLANTKRFSLSLSSPTALCTFLVVSLLSGSTGVSPPSDREGSTRFFLVGEARGVRQDYHC